jgi:CO/xanthine dehydrogenase Mo-binding subunit/aerobic-type carbon monoxide dehydrogenase small subunit (CoxS/CutS family)
MPDSPPRLIGRSLPRKEGREKVTGRALYVDDLRLPGMIYGATVRSPAPRGRIREIHFGEGIPWDEFTIVTPRDLPGENCVAVILKDQPCLAEGVVNHAEEPVLLLAHPDRHLLEAARRAVRIDIEPLPAIFNVDDALAKKEIIWQPPDGWPQSSANIFKEYRLEKGDLDAAWAQAEIIVEGEYETGAQEQLYIEPQGAIAVADPQDGVTVWGSMQCPYYVHKSLVTLFGLPAEKIRVIQTETGGGFGGKEEYPSVIAAHAALLAWKSGRPVKIIYDRAEDMAATTKRHPSRSRIRTGVTRDGKLVALEMEFLLDGGAYCTLSPVVLSRGTIHAAGPYRWPHVRIHSRAVATNFPPNGAFRGFGAPQSIFALERHLDKVARAAGLAPEELRRRNFLREGDTTATGQVIREKINLSALLERAFRESDYYSKREKFTRQNAHSPVKKGIGFATFMHGAGFTGSGEEYLASVVGVEATAEGRVRILVASTEMGQGTNTILPQIAAETLGLDFDCVEMARPDTAAVPNSGPTVASRTCMIVGKLVESAALGLRQTLAASGLLAEKYTPADFRRACRDYIAKFGELKSTSQYQPPPDIHWDDKNFRGDAYGAYAWACYVAEVTVDTRTGETAVDDFVAVQEVGRVIHPVLAAGQIEGGVGQAIGYALSEEVVWQYGRMANSQLTNYIIPTAADAPRIRVFFEEVPYAYGPAGAKGIGELPMDGPAPAVLNAIEHATGASIPRVPATPEVILAALGEVKSETRNSKLEIRPVQPAAGSLPGASHSPLATSHLKTSLRFHVNGAAHTVEAWPMARLLDVLREELKLTGTKEGCGEGECGACAVLINGELVNSCLVPVAQAAGADIITIEGLSTGEALHPVQRAFIDCGGAQCGICTPGMVLAAVHLLAQTPNPGEDEIRAALAGNLCRCTGYTKIFESVLECRGPAPRGKRTPQAAGAGR